MPWVPQDVDTAWLNNGALSSLLLHTSQATPPSLIHSPTPILLSFLTACICVSAWTSTLGHQTRPAPMKTQRLK